MEISNSQIADLLYYNYHNFFLNKITEENSGTIHLNKQKNVRIQCIIYFTLSM